MTPKKLHKLSLIEAQTEMEAISLMFSGFLFFLKNHTKKTVIVLVLFLASFSYMAQDYLTSQKVKIKELSPIGSNFSIMPQLVAGGKNTITIGGKVYGYYDEDVEVWKIQHEDALIFHNHVTGKIWKMEIPSFTKSK